ncbi:hypothetical protein ACWGR3_30610, partial [Streptomyces albidoflavus]
MTFSKPTFAVSIVGSSEPLTHLSSTITLDAGRSPHVDGQITIATPSSAALAALDPKLTPRVVLVMTDELTPEQTRTFNLGVRTRTVPQSELGVQLELLSDEALLRDYKALADDDTPISLAVSLRAVINYVLAQVIPGAALAPGVTDADVHPTWEVTNLHTNPEVVNPYGYGPGQNASEVVRVTFGSEGAAIRWIASGGRSNLVTSPAWDAFRVRPGAWYVFTVEALGQFERTAQACIQWYAGIETSPM